ncbi:MAG: hypothetical protein OEZ10_00450 [Gammaproteobacteria bacterium]|nr:hypothetical protein [Gammaproteobacteria bacterium]
MLKRMQNSFPGILVVLMMTMLMTPASGLVVNWDSYVVPISDAYSLVKVDSVDIFISRTSRETSAMRDLGTPLFLPADFPQLGPLHKVSITDKYIFSQHFGKKHRNLYDGDEVVIVDNETRVWMIVNSRNNDILGPLTFEEFHAWVDALHIPRPENWMSVRELYRMSLRAYPDQVESALSQNKAMIKGMLFAVVAFLLLFGPVWMMLLPLRRIGQISPDAWWTYSVSMSASPAVITATAVVLNAWYLWY